MAGLPVATSGSFTLPIDTNKVPSAAFDAVNNLFGVEEWVQTFGGVWIIKPCDANGYAYMKQAGSNLLIGNYVLTWAANATANTAETVSVPLPAVYQKDALYLVSINNPSALGTAITVTFNNQINFGLGETYVPATSVSITSGQALTLLVQGWLLGDGAAQISGVNNSAASPTGGTVQFQVRAI